MKPLYTECAKNLRVLFVSKETIEDRSYVKVKKEKNSIYPGYKFKTRTVFDQNESLLKALCSAQSETPTLVVLNKAKTGTPLPSRAKDEEVSKIRNQIVEVSQAEPRAKLGLIVLADSSQIFANADEANTINNNFTELIDGIGIANQERLLTTQTQKPIPLIKKSKWKSSSINYLLKYFEAAIRNDGKKLIIGDSEGSESPELHRAAYILSEPWSQEASEEMLSIIRSIKNPNEELTRMMMHNAFDKGYKLVQMIVDGTWHWNNAFEKIKPFLEELEKRNVHLADFRNNQNGTLLHCAGRDINLVKWLVEKGVDPNVIGQTSVGEKTAAQLYREIAEENEEPREMALYTRSAEYLEGLS